MKRSWRVTAAMVAVSLGGLFLWRQSAANHAMVSHVATNAPPAQQPLAAAQEPKSLEPQAPAKPEQRPQVDLVFVLDTTGSMAELIEGAKAKIWEISRLAQEGKPSPTLRVGLVAYRDKGDAYVTRVTDLTTDLDKVYAALTGFRANGGGDGPEHVLAGLNDALNKVHWSSDAQAVKLIYLVGDAPAHTDYSDGITLAGVLRDANQRGVRISAIRCGDDPDTLAFWTKVSKQTDGEVSTIKAGGGVVAVSTPFDPELARLNAALAATEVHYGDATEQREAAEAVKRNLEAPAATQADRAGFYGSLGSAPGKPRALKKDLAAAGPTGASLAAMPADQLPPEMRTMSADERERFVQDKRKEREAILAQIRAASEKRDSYLKSAPKPAPTAAFDTKVYDSLRKAGAKSGIEYVSK
ncbi:VWA domain-containing protein [Pendulispora albinea]|uniref:VWA domain-containing protein n=1 Tax=Pendulispora albinea TaxID=2741071 RepID=A0ABZ2MBN5_9BACT